MSNEEFLEFEEEDSGAANRRPFLTLVGALSLVLILASICTVYLLVNQNDGNGDEVAAIETRNAAVMITNEAVTQTLVAMETEAAQPTNTSEPTATHTAVPTATDTPQPTDTPVVGQGEVDVETEEGDTEAEETESEGSETELGSTDTQTTTTSIEDEGTVGLAETNIDAVVAASDGVSTPIPSLGTGTAEGTLPQTGIDTWGAFVLAFVLIMIFVAARRLRRS